MEKSSILVGGVTILEPVTTLTDFVVVAVCLYAYVYLKEFSKSGPAMSALRLYFGWMAIATLSAALLGHAFFYMTDDLGKVIGWTIGTIPAYLLERGSLFLLKGRISNRQLQTGLGVILIKWILFATLILWPETRSFTWVKLNTTLGMVGLVLPIHGYLWRNSKGRGHDWIIAAIGIGIIPGIIHNQQLNIDPLWFNYHDICHLLMAIVFWVMYRGVDQIGHSRGLDQSPRISA